MVTYEKIMKPSWLLWILYWQAQLPLLLIWVPKIVSGTIATSSTGLFSEPQWKEPSFVEEPPNRIDFLNEHGAAIVCQADGYPRPQIYWQGSDNKIVSNIDNFRTVLSNSTLLIHPFKPASYRQDVHSTTYKCLASNTLGAIRSRDIQVRAVIAQQWSVKVVPSTTRLSLGAGPVLFKCEVDLMGGGRDFIEVTGWKRDGKFITRRLQRFYETTEVESNHFHILPNGDLVLLALVDEDAQSKLLCVTRHKITQQETLSSSFPITFSDKPNHAQGDESNIPESFPAPIVVREGDPIVLHCYGPSSPSTPGVGIRWEKLAGSSWVEMPLSSTSSKFLRQIGSSLVSERSIRSQAGHYRCTRGGGNSKEKIREFEVRVSEPLSVKVAINQAKSPLESTAELTCTLSSSSFSPPPVVWLKDANLINPGGRIRFFPTNVLQVNQIQQDDQGIYQCVARTEMESAQDSVRLELADAQPRLIYGFIEQTLAPGPSVSFRCGFTGWPTPDITWFLDNWPVTLSYDSRILIGNVTSHGHLISYLNISETRVEDGGSYTCKATNRAGSIAHFARLNIYGPPWIRVVPPLIVISGEFFILSCPIAGWPISFSSISWEKDGQRLPSNQRHRIGTNGSLTISLVDKSDSGAYWCSIADTQGRAVRREIQVNVVAPLRIAPFPPSGSVEEGVRMTLVCGVSSGDPPVQIRWSMLPSGIRPLTRTTPTPISAQDDRIPNPNPLNPAGVPLFTVLNTDPFTSLLSISKVTETHAGKYICNASSSAGTTARSHDLTVLVPPKIEPFTFQEGLKEKMMSRLVCGVSQGDLPIEFTWFKDGKRLTMSKDEPWTNNIETSTLDSFSTLLRFSSLNQNHAGLYTCLAKNPASQTYFSAKLVVQVAPRWTQEPEDINITRGRDAQFDCSGYGIPEPKISWLKATGDGAGDGKWRSVETIWPSAAAQAISLANGSLIFSTVEEVHEGQYMCSINNGIGSGLSKVVQLHVHVQPYFVGSESQPISSTQGKTHEISCEAISSSPIYLSWSKGSSVFVNVPANRIHTVIVMEGRRTKSTLVMKDIRSDDSGLYQCTASNSLGKVSRNYQLIVEEQPGAPERLRLAEESQRNGPEATRVYLEWDLHSEYSSKSLPGEDPRPSRARGTTVFPPILMYVLEYSLSTEEKMRFSRHTEIPGERTRAKVDNLNPASIYVFRVRAINSAGSGPPSEHLLVRTANIPPSASPTNGRAAAVSSRAILVSWSPVPIEMTFGKIVAYHIVIGTSNNAAISLGKPVTILVPATVSFRNFHNNATVNEQNCCQTMIHGLNPFTHYEIKVGALNIAGLGPLSPPFSTKTAEEAPQLPPRNPQCLPLTPHSIQISWQHPLQSNGPITSYKVVFYPLEFNTQSHRLGEVHRTSGLTAVIGGLQAHTNYSLHITPINIAGEGSQSLNVFCKTSEDVPSPPSNLIGFPSTDTSVYLSWLHPRKTNGILTHHTIYFRMIDKSSDSYEIKRTVPGNVDSFDETGLSLHRFKYVFWVTSSNRMGESQPSSQLILNTPPIVETRLVGQSRSIEIFEGNPLILPCRILGLESSSHGGSGGSTFPSDMAVSWTLNGKRVGFDGNVYMKPGQSDLIFFGVRKSDQGNYTCQLRNGNKNSSKKSKSTKKPINGMDLPNSQQHLTYGLRVKGIPCIPEPYYKIIDRNIYIAWTVDERSSGSGSGSGCDAPLGFILYFRALGSIVDWKKVIFQPTSRNYTLKEITCGSILNMYMVAFNEVGNSPDSHLMSVVVSHSVSSFPHSQELIVPNITSVLLNLYPINANLTFCPVDKFSIGLKEYRSPEWVSGKDVKIQFRNEYAIDGLKPSTPYEITISIFGYSTSRTASFTFTTLTQFGETPSTDILSKHKVTSEYSPLYSNLTLILPTVVASVAVFAAIVAVIAYCKTRRRVTSAGRDCSSKQQNDTNYGYLQQRKSLPHEDLYSGLPCPPCTPGMEDISPYATFQISDPKKFHEESFSQEIVVAKFHPVMHGIPRGSRDKWIDRDPRQMLDSEDSESETQRYSVIPSQRSRLNNLYQINPPNQPPPPLPYQSAAFHHQHQHQHNQIGDTSDVDDCDSSSSDPSRTTIDRRTGKKDREGRRGSTKKSREMNRIHANKMKESGSATSLRRMKRKSNNSDYSIAV